MRGVAVVLWGALAAAMAAGDATPPSACSSDELAVYRVFLDTRWSRELFPKQYPEWRPPASWSKMVGRTHDASYWLFREGEMASAGMQVFAEKGQSDSLEASDHAGVYDEFTAPPVARGVGRTVADFFLDGNHSLVSVAVRVVPSPDWFIGVDSLDLCRGRHWIDSIAIEVDPMDAGTDNGFTFTAPNWPTEPKDPVARITSKRPSHPANSFHYPKLDKLPSIATLTFVKCRRRGGGNVSTACPSRGGHGVPTPSTATSRATPTTSAASTKLTAVTSSTPPSAKATSGTSTRTTVTSSATSAPPAACTSKLTAVTSSTPPSTKATPETSTRTTVTSSGSSTVAANDTTAAAARVARHVGSLAATAPTSAPAQTSADAAVKHTTVSSVSPGPPTGPAVDAPAARPPGPSVEATVSSAGLAAATAAYVLAERSSARCPSECAEEVPALTPTFALTEMDDIDELLEERVYHLSMELSRNATRDRDLLDGNEISNDLGPAAGLESTESTIRRTSKARRSKKGSRQAKHCQVSEWSPWSACSASCGVGDASRTRRVLEHPRRGGRPCPPLQEHRWCGGHSECPQNFFNW